MVPPLSHPAAPARPAPVDAALRRALLRLLIVVAVLLAVAGIVAPSGDGPAPDGAVPAAARP